MNEPEKVGSIRFSKTMDVIVWLAGLSVLAANIVLVHQNRKLEETVAPQIISGAQIEALSGVGLDGRFQDRDLLSGDSKVLIITFSPGCPACQANQEGWKKLASGLVQKGVRTIWVSRDSVEATKEYCIRHGIHLSSVLADPPYRTYLQLGLSRVPNTLLVGSGGRVEKVWAGRLDVAGWNSLFATLLQGEFNPPSQVGVANDCGSGLSQTAVCN